MFKRSLRYGLFLFAGFTIWQLVSNRGIEWGMNLSVSVVAFLFSLLWEWTKIPYQWKKKHDEH